MKFKIKKVEKHVKGTVKSISKESRKHTATAITTGFAFIIALVWRDAISEGINKMIEVFNITGSEYLYKILTAVIITIIAVIGIILFSRWSEKKED